MKTALAAVTLALFSLAPAPGAACEYNDATSASVTPIEQMAAASTPAASKMPTTVVSKATAPTAVKKSVAVKRIPATDQKVAASATN